MEPKILVAADTAENWRDRLLRAIAAGLSERVGAEDVGNRKCCKRIARENFIIEIVEIGTAERSARKFIFEAVIEPTIESRDLGLAIAGQIKCCTRDAEPILSWKSKLMPGSPGVKLGTPSRSVRRPRFNVRRRVGCHLS